MPRADELERSLRESRRPAGERSRINSDEQELHLVHQRMYAARDDGDYQTAANRAAEAKMICDRISAYITYIGDRNFYRDQARGYRRMELEFKKLAGQKLSWREKLFG